jgi:hypothetical protein
MGQDLGCLGETVIKVIGLCQHFQKKPRHGLVTARLSVESQSRWELEGDAATKACASPLQ